MLWLALIFMSLCAGAFVALPFLGQARVAAPSEDASEALKAELTMIAASQARGDLNDEGAAAARIDAQRRALRPATASSAGIAPADRRMAAIIAAIVLVAAGSLYGLTGHPELTHPTPAPSPAAGAQAQLEQLTATLQQHVSEEPGNADGWRALGWAYFMAARYQDAAQAYERAITLRPEAAAFHSAYGETLVALANGAVTPKAQATFQEALRRDKADVRARFYLGLYKAQHNDPKAAIADWLALYKQAPPGSDAAQDLKARIHKLASQSGIDVTADLGPSPPPAEDVARMSDQERDAMIDAMVTTLDQRLRENPQNLEGWIRLVRARIVQGKIPEAEDALSRGRAAFAGDIVAQAKFDELEVDIKMEKSR